MIVVNPDERFTLSEVQKHSFFKRDSDIEYPLNPPILCPIVDMKSIPAKSDLDSEVLKSISCLGCFKEEDKLIKMLLKPEKNTEKMIYFLLLDRKDRKPGKKDDEDPLVYGHAAGKTLFSYILGFILMIIMQVYGKCRRHWRVIIITLTILFICSSVNRVYKIVEVFDK